MEFLDKEGVKTLWGKIKEDLAPIRLGLNKTSVIIGNGIGAATGSLAVAYSNTIADNTEYLSIRLVTDDDISKDSDAKNYKYISVDGIIPAEFSGYGIYNTKTKDIIKILKSKYSDSIDNVLFNTDSDLDLYGATYMFGDINTASGAYSYAEGSSTTASGNCSHAEGSSTTASGAYSHAEGTGTVASGICSHAEGSGTVASGPYSHAEGYYNKPSIRAIHLVGIGNADNKKNAEEIHFDITSDKNGYKYVIGIGGYDGTNAYSDPNKGTLNTDVKSVQLVINELQSTIDELKNRRFVYYTSDLFKIKFVSGLDMNNIDTYYGGDVDYAVYDTTNNFFAGYLSSADKYYFEYQYDKINGVSSSNLSTKTKTYKNPNLSYSQTYRIPGDRVYQNSDTNEYYATNKTSGFLEKATLVEQIR